MNIFATLFGKGTTPIENSPGTDFSDVARLQILLEKFSNFDLIIDAGAALGTWGSAMRGVCLPSTSIIAVEPLPIFYNQLESLNVYDEIFPCVISESSGSAKLHVSRDLFSSSLLYPGESVLSVEARTLESIIKSFSKKRQINKILIKLDLQGMDFIALVSAGEYLDNIAVVQMECQLAPYTSGMEYLSDRILRMSKLNFEIFDIYGHLDRPSDGALGQVDILFVNRNLSGFFNEIW